MHEDVPTDQSERRELERAREQLSRQAAEIEHLRRRLASERFSEDLRRALILSATAGRMVAPISHPRLLEMIVETAAHVISARAAALFLIDLTTDELIFEVALGEKAQEVKKYRIPLGHGIAGLVAVSGQPMAISDAQDDPRQASDVAQSVGYIPRSILCVPLIYGERVIGVLELLDKEGAPSFNTMDMSTLGLFANQAAVAIEQSRTHHNLEALVGNVVQSLHGVSESQRDELGKGAGEFAALMVEDEHYQRALRLANIAQEISERGDAETMVCESILREFAAYLRSRDTLSSGLGGRA